MTEDKWRIALGLAWRGAAFDRCQTADRTGPKIMAQPNVGEGRLAALLSSKPQDLGDKAWRASLFRLQEENQGVKLWG